MVSGPYSLGTHVTLLSLFWVMGMIQPIRTDSPHCFQLMPTLMSLH